MYVSNVSDSVLLQLEPWPPKGFPLFSALRMASPVAIMLLTVNYHADMCLIDPRDSLCTPLPGGLLMTEPCAGSGIADVTILSRY